VEVTNHFVTNSITVLIHSAGSSPISLSIIPLSSSILFHILTIWYQIMIHVTLPLQDSRHPKSDESMDPSFCLILDELWRMEAHLRDKIEGRCSGLGKCIVKANRNLRSISSLCQDGQAVRWPKTQSQSHQLLPRAQEHGKLAREARYIFRNNESVSARPPSSIFTDGLDGHRVESHHRDREFGSIFTHTHVPVNDMPHSISLPCGIENSHGNNLSSQPNSYFEYVHASQRRLPKIHFALFNGEDP
jgi:hypothetical protein